MDKQAFASEATDAAGAAGLLALAVLLWGGNWVIMKLGLQSFPPLWLNCLRMLLGGAPLLLLLAARRRPLLPPLRDRLPLAVTATLYITLPSLLIILSLLFIPGGLAAFLAFTTPLWVLPLAWLLLRERPGKGAKLGLGLGLGGLALLVRPASLDGGGAGQLLGSGLALGAGLAWAVAIVLLRRWHLARAGGAHEGLRDGCWQLLVSGASFALAAPLVEGPCPWPETAEAWLLLFYFGTLGTGLSYWAGLEASRRLPAVVGSLGFLGTPPIGLLLCWLFLDERPGALMLAGAAAVLAGAGLAVLRGAR